jgi:tRNA A-37 threonylcarbamoyl transferase component Bud32/tetratricopeptide (TPR) repeat protein
MITMSVETIGRYEILETLGRGAMGVVYLARDPIIDRRVALKTLRVDLDVEHADEFRERFIREARAAGRLNHPGIVTIHDVGEDPESGLVYIAMEYIEGRDLKQIMASGQRFRPSEVSRIAADVALALDYAHSMGVVHRDIKPANIILTQDGTAKIMDFGVARLEASNLTVDGQFIGTPNFMSPEQITGKTVDGRSDLFSLGVVMFNLLTGQRPFTGESMHEVTLRIVQDPCPIPSTVGEDIPAALNPIVLKCLEKNPERRFQTGGALAQVLAALARSLVQREPGDAGSTGVYQPDLETRIHVAQRARAAAAEASAEDLVARWRLPAWLRIRLPDFMYWEVRPRWAWSIIAACGLVLLLVVLGLRLGIDHGPFDAPSEGSIKNLNGVVFSLLTAQDRLLEGNLAAAQAAVRAALDQAPTSPAARRIAAAVRRALEEERTSEENQAKVAALVTEGRRLYRNGSYASAAARFREALDLDSHNEIAASYLELSEERARGARRRTSTTSPTRTGRTQSPVAPALPSPTPVPGIARITLFFDSPISAGTVSVTLDGESLAEVPFDFSHAGFLGFKRKGRGTVKRVILTPSGRRAVGIQLIDAKSGPLGSSTFTKDLPPGSEWTLRVDLPSSTARPSFFLVPKATR